jgi:lipopolysaccharide transport system permease protein
MSASALFNMTLALPVVLLGAWWVGGHSGDYLSVRADALAAGKDVGPLLQLGAPLVLLPLLYALQMVFMTGLGFFMATLNVLVRDVQQLVGVATMVWMFTTPIFYPAELVRRAGFGFLLEVNPMYWLIDSYRSVLMYGAWPDWGLLLRFTVAALIVLGIGTRFLALHRRRFPDLL